MRFKATLAWEDIETGKVIAEFIVSESDFWDKWVDEINVSKKDHLVPLSDAKWVKARLIDIKEVS
mgnify:FL=1